MTRSMGDFSGSQPVAEELSTGQDKLAGLSPHSVLRLRGTPYAIGVEHGRQLARDIVRLEADFLTFLGEFCGGGSGGRRRARAIYWAARLLAGAMVLRYWPARYGLELRGIVTGMRRAGYGGFGLTRLAVMNSFDDLAGAFGRRCAACSAFAVRGDCGGILVGRNLDYQVIPQSLAALNTMFIYHPAGYTPFVSWGWPGYIGVATGVNANRLSLSLLTSPTRDASSQGVPEGLVNRLVLEETQTPSEAFNRLKTLPRTVGTNLLLATPDHASVIESSRTHLVLRSMQADQLVATNHFQTPEMVPSQAEFVRVSESLLEERFLSLEGSRRRAQNLAAALHAGMTIPEALRLLTDPEWVSSGQVQSLVIDLARSALWVATGPMIPAYASGYRHLEWNELFV